MLYTVVIEGGRALEQGQLLKILSRTDLPIRLKDEAFTVVEAVIGDVDNEWHLARLDFSGGQLWFRDPGLIVGHRVRTRILARDVSLAKQPPRQSSIQNVLHGKVEAIGADEHPGLAIVRILIGNSRFLARLTRRALADLNLEPVQNIWIQVKSVALME